MAGVYFSYDKRGLTPFVIKLLHIQFYDEKLKKDCTGRYVISFIAHNRCNLKNKKCMQERAYKGRINFVFIAEFLRL